MTRRLVRAARYLQDVLSGPFRSPPVPAARTLDPAGGTA